MRSDFSEDGSPAGLWDDTVQPPTSPHEAAIDRLAGAIYEERYRRPWGDSSEWARAEARDAAALLLASNGEADDRSRPQPIPVSFSMSIGWLSFALAFLVCTLVASLWSTWLIAFPTP